MTLRHFGMRVFAAGFGFALAGAISAQGRYGTTPEMQYNPAVSNRELVKQIGIEQRLGAPLPLEAEFRDENGDLVKLGDFFQSGRPVILAPIFYRCEGTCLLVTQGVLKAINLQKRLKAGQDFDLVFLSIHPKETPELAKGKKALWIKDYKFKNTEHGWHLLTGRPDEIRKVTDAIGFKFTYDRATDRISHPGMILVCTPDGRASEYLTGSTYPQKTLYDALMIASKNEIGQETEMYLLGCITVDPRSGQMRVNVQNVLRVACILTALVLFGSVAFMAHRYRVKPLAVEPGGQGGPGSSRNFEK